MQTGSVYPLAFFSTGYGHMASPVCYNCQHMAPSGHCHDIRVCPKGQVNRCTQRHCSIIQTEYYVSMLICL